eukprot:2700635-Rhodomonas_salina.4
MHSSYLKLDVGLRLGKHSQHITRRYGLLGPGVGAARAAAASTALVEASRSDDARRYPSDSRQASTCSSRRLPARQCKRAASAKRLTGQRAAVAE